MLIINLTMTVTIDLGPFCSSVSLCECTKLRGLKGFIIRNTLVLHHSLSKI